MARRRGAHVVADLCWRMREYAFEGMEIWGICCSEQHPPKEGVSYMMHLRKRKV